MSDVSEAVYVVTDDTAILSGDPKRMHPFDLKLVHGRTPITTARFLELSAQARLPTDLRGLSPEADDPEVIETLSEAALETMVGKAVERSNDLTFLAVALMIAGTAEFVRELRVDLGHSWRNVASLTYEHLGTRITSSERRAWWPPSNQLMGMALCEQAAKHFGENYLSAPWN